ncbi:type II secretion system protein M [Candidatus Coxiella mudrowiae]|uniref:type II secretion system protein M n=1 Tax=Candidatus Coxiella mudrowiae TaxID=2054173 RepID=UPI000662A070|nr:type II secretion system protein M [Candidatus Coxiella mudrowiae]
MRQEGFGIKQATQPLLVIAERTTLTEQKLSAYLQEVQKLESNKVTLTFHQVPFDDWMDWVQLLSKKIRNQCRAIEGTKNEPVGTVDTIIVLSK